MKKFREFIEACRRLRFRIRDLFSGHYIQLNDLVTKEFECNQEDEFFVFDVSISDTQNFACGVLDHYGFTYARVLGLEFNFIDEELHVQYVTEDGRSYIAIFYNVAVGHYVKMDLVRGTKEVVPC